MRMQIYVEALKDDLSAAAAAGDEQVASAAARLVAVLDPALRLRLLDLLGEAARELGDALPEGRVEVRLVGADPELVYVEDAPTAAAPAADDAFSARITLRLPDGLKAGIEAAAAREGVSANSWIVSALGRAVEPRRGKVGNRLTGFGQS
ncbi:MAG: YlcI/YnfO family protein [Gaiellaceae bacterium]